MHLRCEEAEIFGDHLPLTDHILQSPEQFHAGTLDPCAVHGRILRFRNLVVRFEAAEMIDPDGVIEKEGMLHT